MAVDDRLLLGEEPLRPRSSSRLCSCVVPAAIASAGLIVIIFTVLTAACPAILNAEGSSSTQSRPRTVHEIALVNFIRHGERNQNPADTGLTADGKLRAAYLGRCIGLASDPSLAFPLGPPTALLASVHESLHASSTTKISTRPADTLQPVQDALKLTEGVQLARALNISGVERRVQGLAPGETLLVAWQHDFIPMLVNSLRPPAPTLIETFPLQCNNSHYQEPAYTLNDPGGSCYDILWQVVLQRPQSRPGETARKWHAASLTQFHQGFAGDSLDSLECREALAPMASDSALFGDLALRRRWRTG